MESGIRSEQIKEQERQHVIHRINPHFIFNTLAAIRIITKMNSDLAYDMVYDFSKYLRAVFQSLTSPGNVSFREELDYITAYTNLEKMRFGENIIFHMHIEETDFMLPILSLQSLVNNAIVHGLRKGKRKGNVSIRSFRTSSEYIVQVIDDGIGFDAEPYKKVQNNKEMELGGLHRVKCQIEEMIGGSIEVNSIIGEGTVITLHIPENSKGK